MKIDTKKMTTLALLVSVAMILSYIESLVPAFVAVPGVKLGLSNIATVFALYTLGWPSAIAVSLVRVLLSALLFGNIPSLIFSIAGAALALASMIPLSRLNLFTSIGVSVVGAVCHNIGQVLAAIIVMKTSGIAYYLIPLLFSGTISGIVIGIVSGILVERIKKYL
ncbi:MAG: Gx transporter family protein [Ruminococcaceae bacterium]|nr:Gx transporter family protein [Oscillospiraceae bacterium]